MSYKFEIIDDIKKVNDNISIYKSDNRDKSIYVYKMMIDELTLKKFEDKDVDDLEKLIELRIFSKDFEYTITKKKEFLKKEDGESDYQIKLKKHAEDDFRTMSHYVKSRSGIIEGKKGNQEEKLIVRDYIDYDDGQAYIVDSLLYDICIVDEKGGGEPYEW